MNTRLESGTAVKHYRFGVGRVINYVASINTYLVYFPFQHDLHNGRLIQEGIPGYATNQYWWCDLKYLTVITEEEYERGHEVVQENEVPQINTKVNHNRYGVGEIVHCATMGNEYLVKFPFQHDLHNGNNVEGQNYDTRQYWWCKCDEFQVISEKEYKKLIEETQKEKEESERKMLELMDKFKVGDTIKFIGSDGWLLPYLTTSAALLKVIEYDVDSKMVTLQPICDSNTYALNRRDQMDIEKLKYFAHYTINCDCCGEEITIDGVIDKDGNVMCPDCFNKAVDNGDIIKCECCGEYVSNDDANYIDNVDTTVCYDCCDEYYRICEGCGEVYHIDTMYYHDHHDSWYCECCYPGDNAFEPVFNSLVPLEKGKRYFGMELEVENYDRYSYGITDQIMDIMGDDVILEIKEDGSLDCGGFEIVFQPLSEEYINSDEFKDKLTKLSNLLQRNNFYKEAPNGGLHIHTTRLGGEDIADLYTLTRFFESELTGINGRFNSNWCRIGDYTTDYGKNKDIVDSIQGDTRYQWWNTTNRATIECRAFDSSLDVDTILSNYNFVINAFKYRCDKKVNNITWDMLMGKSTHITKTTKVYSVDTLRYIKQMYKTNNGKVRAIKHIMGIIEKELRVQLDALNYNRVAMLGNELRQLNNIMSNSFTLKDYSLEYIANLGRTLDIEELNEYVRHL